MIRGCASRDDPTLTANLSFEVVRCIIVAGAVFISAIADSPLIYAGAILSLMSAGMSDRTGMILFATVGLRKLERREIRRRALSRCSGRETENYTPRVRSISPTRGE